MDILYMEYPSNYLKPYQLKDYVNYTMLNYHILNKMEEEAKKIIELHYNIIEKFVDDNYRDILAKELAITHCELIIKLVKNFIEIYGVGNPILKEYIRLKETIKQV